MQSFATRCVPHESRTSAHIIQLKHGPPATGFPRFDQVLQPQDPRSSAQNPTKRLRNSTIASSVHSQRSATCETRRPLLDKAGPVIYHRGPWSMFNNSFSSNSLISLIIVSSDDDETASDVALQRHPPQGSKGVADFMLDSLSSPLPSYPHTWSFAIAGLEFMHNSKL